MTKALLFMYFLLNTTAHSWKSRATKSACGVHFAHFLQSQYFCHTHAQLTCGVSTGKQRKSTRLINAQCELSEGIWGRGVSVEQRERSSSVKKSAEKRQSHPKFYAEAKLKND